MLIRYWFSSSCSLGVGVTAFSAADAEALIRDAGLRPGIDVDLEHYISNVDVRSLDQSHVVPNMGPPNVRGVWFPCLNL